MDSEYTHGTNYNRLEIPNSKYPLPELAITENAHA